MHSVSASITTTVLASRCTTETSQEFLSKLLLERGDQFEVKTTEQYYDPEIDQFLADRYIKGECPNCGNPEALRRPVRSVRPRSLADRTHQPGIGTVSGATPELRETKHWFFRLDEHAAWLKTWIQDGTLEGEQLHDPSEWETARPRASA